MHGLFIQGLPSCLLKTLHQKVLIKGSVVKYVEEILHTIMSLCDHMYIGT